MNRVYFLETSAREQRVHLCRWVEHFHNEGRKVQIAVDSTTAAQHLDQLLWTFSEESFIPHSIIRNDASSEDPEPVVITIGDLHLDGRDVLVCDTTPRLEWIGLYPITLLFVIRDDEDRKQESRIFWQRVKDEGHEPRYIPYESADNPASAMRA